MNSKDNEAWERYPMSFNGRPCDWKARFLHDHLPEKGSICSGMILLATCLALVAQGGFAQDIFPHTTEPAWSTTEAVNITTIWANETTEGVNITISANETTEGSNETTEGSNATTEKATTGNLEINEIILFILGEIEALNLTNDDYLVVINGVQMVFEAAQNMVSLCHNGNVTTTEILERDSTTANASVTTTESTTTGLMDSLQILGNGMKLLKDQYHSLLPPNGSSTELSSPTSESESTTLESESAGLPAS